MKAGGSQWRMLWRKSPRRPANSTAPQSQNLGELDLELKVIPPTYAPPRPSPRWKTAHQPPEASASSYDLSRGFDRRVARIVLTTSSLAFRSSRQWKGWRWENPTLFAFGQPLQSCRALLWCFLRDGFAQSPVQNRGLLRIEYSMKLQSSSSSLPMEPV